MTLTGPIKLVPDIVKAVPPLRKPALVLKTVGFGGLRKLKAPPGLDACPSLFVTTALTVEIELLSVIQVRVVLELTVTELQLVEPNATVAPSTKPVPEIVIISPPSVLPFKGEIAVTAGASR